ncbi:Hsp20/alpha crystallin family protein [Natronorarus salvus]|uniref:Hsp20/alpha crystallin family protein n=1 Tax=Natronorarus salvus TaxID=3117733 RepID=UPI002F26092F
MTRRNPFEEIEEFFDRMSRGFEEGEWAPTTIGAQQLAVDLADEGDAFVVTADLPGYEREEISLTLAERTLELSAEQETERVDEDEEVNYIRRERRRRSVGRAVRLPEAVDEEATSARYANGVLTVRLPKVEAEEGTSISIE